MINDEGEVVHQYCKMNPWIPTERHYPGWECPVTPGPKGQPHRHHRLCRWRLSRDLARGRL